MDKCTWLHELAGDDGYALLTERWPSINAETARRDMAHREHALATLPPDTHVFPLSHSVGIYPDSPAPLIDDLEWTGLANRHGIVAYFAFAAHANTLCVWKPQ